MKRAPVYTYGMATISAYGCVKLAEAHYDLYIDSITPGFQQVRYFYVLRSDGAVLVASSYPQADHAYDRKRGGYTLRGKLKAGPDVEAFRRYVTKQAQRRGTVAVFK